MAKLRKIEEMDNTNDNLHAQVFIFIYLFIYFCLVSFCYKVLTVIQFSRTRNGEQIEIN